MTRQDDRQELEDISSAPESGTVRDETSGNNPAMGGDRVRQTQSSKSQRQPSSDPSSAPESGTVRGED